jgi:apolipoprotein N-acyltransferase
MMKTRSDRYSSLLLLLTGGLLVGFSMGSWLAPLAAWIGPVLIMRYARDHRRRVAFLRVVAIYVLAFAIGYGAIWTPFVGWLAVPILATIYGLLWSLPYLADRLVSARLQDYTSTLAYPLAATTIEFLVLHAVPIGVWGATGFTQYGNLPLMQLASVTGMIGITFLMGWFASVANWAWENRSSTIVVLRGVGIFGVVLAIVLLLGSLRLNVSATTQSGETIRVAGVTGESENLVWERVWSYTDPIIARLDVQSHWDAYFSQTIREANAGAQLVLWPEGSGMALDDEQATSLIAQAQDIARQHGIYLAIGGMITHTDTGRPQSNKLLLIGPTGEILIDHIKYGANWGLERGNRVLQFAKAPFGVISGIVCWDMDFPAVIRQAGQGGAGLFLDPSKDWVAIDPAHSQMAVFRAIENGMSILRQTDTGLSIATDPYGRVLAQTDFFSAADPTLVAQVPVEHVTTIYSLFGYWLDWLAPVGLLFIIANSIRKGRKSA